MTFSIDLFGQANYKVFSHSVVGLFFVVAFFSEVCANHFKKLTGQEMASSKAGLGAHNTVLSVQGAVLSDKYTVHSLYCPVVEMQELQYD